MRPRLLACGVALVALFGLMSEARASSITYDVTGMASGTIGGTSFTDALVDFKGFGDTGGVVTVGGLLYANPLTSVQVTIAGIGTATLTEASGIWGFPVAIADPRLPPFPLVVMGRVDSPPALDSFTGFGGVGSDALAGYDLATAIGPIAGAGGIGFIDACSTPGHDACLGTTLGLLSFTSNVIPTGSGAFTATVSPAPEPASLLLLGAGGASFLRRSRRLATRR